MGNPIQFSKAHAQFDEPAHGLGAANEQIHAELLKMSGKQRWTSCAPRA